MNHMLLADIVINSQAAPKDTWETLLPALLGILGVLIGAWVSNIGQHRRDRAATAHAIRTTALSAVAAVMAYLGNVSTLITFATAQGLPGWEEKSREAQDAATAGLSEAQKTVAVLVGVADSEVATHSSSLHLQLIEIDNDLVPLLRERRFKEARDSFDRHRDKIQRGSNILIFMVQARDRLQTGGWWTGYPFFRSRNEAELYHDNLRD